MNWLKLSALMLVCVLGLALVACGDDDDDTGDDVGATTAPATETEAPDDETEAPDDETEAPDDETEAPDDETEAPDDETEAPGDPQTNFDVQAIDFDFAPQMLTVPAGTEVAFAVSNDGAAPHTMTVYSDEDYSTAVEGADTGTLAGGEDATITATFDAGMYFFRCDIHPVMEGTITAE